MRVALLTLLAACAAPAGRSVAAGDLAVELAVDPDPPAPGENRLRVLVKDAAGHPVDGAKLALTARMPAMGSMPEMKGGGEVRGEGGGRYVVTYPLAMNGDWSLVLAVEAAGHPPATLRLTVAPPRRGFTVENGEARAGAAGIDVPLARRQLIGVTFAAVEEKPLAVTLRAPGRVEIDERKLADVTLKYEAYVERLLVAETGKSVKAGEALLVVYSPDLLAAETELANAVHAGAAPELAAAARSRLTLWDVPAAEVAAVERGGKITGRLTLTAPAGGVVLEKNVVAGARVGPGTTLYRIGNLGRVWVQAAVPERDALLVAVGQAARVALPGAAPLDAQVTFVAPMVDEKTRTLAARLELANPTLALKPGMFADVVVEVPLGTKLAVPDGALLLSGGHRYAFVDRGEGRLEPVEVEVGATAGDLVEVRGGLRAGDRVANGATFLLASEARLRDALPRWKASTEAGR
jgi:membrane fusion protein, copper/silver efflux system